MILHIFCVKLREVIVDPFDDIPRIVIVEEISTLSMYHLGSFYETLCFDFDVFNQYPWKQ